MCGLGQPTIHLLDTAGPRGHVYLPVNGKFTKEAKCSPGHPASDDAPGPLVALQTGAAAAESSVEAPRKVKNRTPSDPAIPLPGIYTKKPKTPLQNHFPTLAAASSARARTRRHGTCVSPRGRGAGKRRYAETVRYRAAMNDDVISPLVTVRRPRRALRGGRQVRGRQTPNAVADTWDPSGKANERHGDGPTDERTSRRAPDGRGPGAGGRRRSGLRGGYGHSHGGQGPWRARSRRGARRGGSRQGALRGPCPSARHAAPPKPTRDDAGCQMSPAVETGHGGGGKAGPSPSERAPAVPPPARRRCTSWPRARGSLRGTVPGGSVWLPSCRGVWEPGPHRSPPRLLQPCGRVPGTPRRPRLPVSQSWAPELPFAPPPPSGRCSPPERPPARVLLSVDPVSGAGGSAWLAPAHPRDLDAETSGRLPATCSRSRFGAALPARRTCPVPHSQGARFQQQTGPLAVSSSREVAGRGRRGRGARLWGGPVRAFGPGVVTAGTFFPF